MDSRRQRPRPPPPDWADPARAPPIPASPGAERGAGALPVSAAWKGLARGSPFSLAGGCARTPCPAAAAEKEVSQLSRRAMRWLGLDCCTFFFVRCIFRNKKKSPTLHTTSFASQEQKPGHSGLGTGDHCLPISPAWAPAKRNQNEVTCCPPFPNITSVSFRSSGRTPATQFFLTLSGREKSAVCLFPLWRGQRT